MVVIMAQKKAEMGVGTLIIFIAMLLVAAVAAGVLIQTASSLQEKSLATGQQSRSQISTNLRSIEVSASSGNNQSLTEFRQIVKLSPGSEPIKLNALIITFNTENKTSTLKYRGTSGICHKSIVNGYNTLNEQEFGLMEVWRYDLQSGDIIGPGIGAGEELTILDFDDDGVRDKVRSCDASTAYCDDDYDGYLQFNLSNDGNPNVFYIPIINDNGTFSNLSIINVPFNFTRINITDDNGVSYGFFSGFRDSGPGASYYITGTDSGIRLVFYENQLNITEDLDDDKEEDSIVINGTHAILFLSSQGNASIPLGEDVSASPPKTVLLNRQPFTLNGVTYAYLTVNATTTRVRFIDADSVFTLIPYNISRGYFTAAYQTEGTNHVDGYVQRGDIVKLCYESPEIIKEDANVRIRLIPKIGTPTLTEFVTPDVMNTEIVYLYP